MSWHGMMRLMQAIATMKEEGNQATEKLRLSRNYDARNTGNQMQHARGSGEKVHHHHNDASPYCKMNSTIAFLTEFYPKTMYNMICLEEGRTNGKQRKIGQIKAKQKKE